MQLDPGEKAIFGYFNNQNTAFAAAADLRTVGYQEVKVEAVARTSRLDKIPRGMTHTHTYSGLSYIDEFTNMAGPDVARLGSNLHDNTVYPQDISDGQRYLVTVVTKSANAERASSILRERGALL